MGITTTVTVVTYDGERMVSAPSGTSSLVRMISSTESILSQATEVRPLILALVERWLWKGKGRNSREGKACKEEEEVEETGILVIFLFYK